MPSSNEFKRQLAFWVPKADWRAVRDEFRRRNVTIPDLLREWVAEPIKRLRESESMNETNQGSNQR